MHSRSGYVAKTPRLLMEWSFSVFRQIKVKVKVKVKVGLFVTYTIIQSTISSEMQGFLKKNTA